MSFTKTYLPGYADITINYVGEPSEKQKEKCVVMSYALPLDGPAKYEFHFNGSQEEAFELFSNDPKANIIVDIGMIETTCKDFSEVSYKPLLSEIEQIIEDCEDTDYGYNGEDEYAYTTFNKTECASRIKQLINNKLMSIIDDTGNQETRQELINKYIIP
jgi:hypothetical protein